MKIDVRPLAVLLAFGLGAGCNKRPESPVFGDKTSQSGGEIPGKTSGTGSDADGSDKPTNEGKTAGGSDKPTNEADGADKPTGGTDKPGNEGKPQPENPDAKAKAELTAACTPGEIEVKNQDADASAIYGKAIPDPKTILSEIALSDCLSMYKKPEEVPKRQKITIVIRTMDGVAYATPHNGEIHFSAKYIKDFSNGKDPAAIKQEMYGVMVHEINHLYQNFWKDGKYTPFSEGICDAIRARANLYPEGRKRKGGTYMDSYTTTGYFLLHLDGKYPDFIYKMNQAAKNWSDNFWQQTTGKSADELWAEYQNSF